MSERKIRFRREATYLRLSGPSRSGDPGQSHADRNKRSIESSSNGGSPTEGAVAPAGNQAALPLEIPSTSEALHSAGKAGDGQATTAKTGFDTYEAFYGMREPPFTLTPNPAFFFINDRGREGLKQIEYGIRRREGFAVICGDVGTGKTTLCWALLERLEKMNVRTALVLNPTLSATDILKCILHDLGVRPKGVAGEQVDISDRFVTSWMAGMGQTELIERLNTFLVQMARKGLFAVVIIDEAQGLSMETLEQLRLLSNLEMANQKLLQIIFVGQLELEQMLEKPELRQLNQSISVRFETKPLPRKDAEDYILHRLRIAWAIPRLRFKKRAFKTIYRLSGGYPRLINMICDRALWRAFQEESYVVTPRIVRQGFNSTREPSRDRTSIWIRRLILVAGALVLALLIIFLLVWKIVTPGTGFMSSPAIPPPSPTAAASNEIQSAEAETPPAVDARVSPKESTPVAAETRPAAAVETAKPPGREEYILQTSSFRESGNAKAASEEIKARGIPSFLEYHETDADGGWFRVYAGPYSELSLAVKAASKLEADLGRKPLLRRRTVE